MREGKEGKKRGFKGLAAPVTGATLNTATEGEFMAQQREGAAEPSYTPTVQGQPKDPAKVCTQPKVFHAGPRLFASPFKQTLQPH